MKCSIAVQDYVFAKYSERNKYIYVQKKKSPHTKLAPSLTGVPKLNWSICPPFCCWLAQLYIASAPALSSASQNCECNDPDLLWIPHHFRNLTQPHLQEIEQNQIFKQLIISLLKRSMNLEFKFNFTWFNFTLNWKEIRFVQPDRMCRDIKQAQKSPVDVVSSDVIAPSLSEQKLCNYKWHPLLR